MTDLTGAARTSWKGRAGRALFECQRSSGWGCGEKL